MLTANHKKISSVVYKIQSKTNPTVWYTVRLENKEVHCNCQHSAYLPVGVNSNCSHALLALALQAKELGYYVEFSEHIEKSPYAEIGFKKLGTSGGALYYKLPPFVTQVELGKPEFTVNLTGIDKAIILKWKEKLSPFEWATSLIAMLTPLFSLKKITTHIKQGFPDMSELSSLNGNPTNRLASVVFFSESVKEKFFEQIKDYYSIKFIPSMNLCLFTYAPELDGVLPVLYSQVLSFSASERELGTLKGIPTSRLVVYGSGNSFPYFKNLVPSDYVDIPELTVDMVQTFIYLLSDYNTVVEEENKPCQLQKTNGISHDFSSILSIYKKYLKGKDKVNYFANSRYFTPEQMKQWGVAYAPDSYNFLTPQVKDDIDFLLERGVLKEGENGGVYDALRNRIIIPIRDTQGNIVSFSGRAIDKGQEPKYLNLASFSKGRYLYGLFENKELIEAKGYTLIVEGYTDVWRCTEFDYPAVSPFGLSVTPSQWGLLTGLNEVVFCLDNDKAGYEALFKQLAHIPMQSHMAITAFTCPGYKDPDESLLNSPEHFSQKFILRKNIFVFLAERSNSIYDVKEKGAYLTSLIKEAKRVYPLYAFRLISDMLAVANVTLEPDEFLN